ncbi:MAG: hypothetical protein HPY53_05950 [Brevinematales bacterium]|nr:hypothetical protein [Brevinematales bacterium]
MRGAVLAGVFLFIMTVSGMGKSVKILSMGLMLDITNHVSVMSGDTEPVNGFLLAEKPGFEVYIDSYDPLFFGSIEGIDMWDTWEKAISSLPNKLMIENGSIKIAYQIDRDNDKTFLTGFIQSAKGHYFFNTYALENNIAEAFLEKAIRFLKNIKELK